MKKMAFLTILGMGLQIFPSIVQADAPGLIYFAGQLATPDANFTGNKSITFSIWDNPSLNSGTSLFSETQQSVPAANGAFTALMGSTQGGIPVSVFQNGVNRYLQVDVPGETTAPRMQLAAAPYAMAVAGISQNNGRVGLGTSTPNDRLQVVFNDPYGAITGYSVQNTSNGNNAAAGMLIYDYTGALTVFQGYLNISQEYRMNNIAPNGTLNFLIGGVSSLYFAHNGNVGIGNTTPNAKFQVTGGDLAVSSAGSGVILKATDNASVCYRLTVNSTGNLSTKSVTCP